MLEHCRCVGVARDGVAGYFPSAFSAAGCGPAVSAAVSTWLQMDGPRLDCANSYDDETSVGAGIAAALEKGVNRHDFFLLTKTGAEEEWGAGLDRASPLHPSLPCHCLRPALPPWIQRHDRAV